MPGITPADVLKARKALVGLVDHTPLTRSSGLSELSGAEVYIKWENLQRTGSYKPRGALYRMSLLTQDERQKGVITASAGNWALGVALAARSMGVAAKICVPANTPNVKVDRCRVLGAEIVLHGNYFDEAFVHAQELVKREGRAYISGTDDHSVFAGHGTVGFEISEELPEVEKVLVPVGGGGLMTGIACWMKAVNPSLKAVGVQSTAARTMYECFRAKRLVDVPVPPTLCEGLAGGITQLNLDLALRHMDDVVLSEEGKIRDAIIWTMKNERQIVEGSGVVGIAAILQGKVRFSRGEKIAVVVSGGNIDLDRIGVAV